MGSHRRPDIRLTAATWRITGGHPDCRQAVEAALPPCPPVRVYQPKHARKDTTVTNQFWRDNTHMVFEEIEPGRIRCVTGWDGSRYVQEQTVSKAYWETLRGPLVEVPNPFATTEMRNQ